MTVIGLALTIGVGTVIFAIVNAAVLRPLSVPDSSSVVVARLMHSNGWWLRWPYSAYLRLRDAARLVQLEAQMDHEALLGDIELEEVRLALVSGGFFETFDVRAAIGRGITDDDDRAASSPVVAVNHTFWKRRLGGDESIVGQTVQLMGTPFMVVGVIEPGFTGIDPLEYNPPAFWAPLGITMRSGVWQSDAPEDLQVRIFGRIADGTTRGQAEAKLSALVANLAEQRLCCEGRQNVHARLEAADDRLSDGYLRWFLVTIMFLLGLVLLIACTNVANLLLAATVTRRREVGLRLAIGPSRRRS